MRIILQEICCTEVNPCEFGAEMDPAEILKGVIEKKGEERRDKWQDA